MVLASPSISSGVDISFEDQEQKFDVVYGFFESNISTHFDCDQQLSRVRNPGSVRVYVSHQTSEFETNIDVVEDDLKQSSLLDSSVTGFNENGDPLYSESDLQQLASLIISVQRASKNALRRNFIAYTKLQGWEIDNAGVDPQFIDDGQIVLNIGTNLSQARYQDKIMSANLLSDSQYDDVRKSISSQRRTLSAGAWFSCSP